MKVLKISLISRVPASSVVSEDSSVLVLVSWQRVRVSLRSRMQIKNFVHIAAFVILMLPLANADPGVFEQYFDQLLNDSRASPDPFMDDRSGYDTYPAGMGGYDGHRDVTSPDEGETNVGAPESTVSPLAGIVEDALSQGRLGYCGG